MPELPEVETVANGVHARVAGARIREVWFSEKPEPMKSAPDKMADTLTGAIITRVHRVGKTVVFDLKHGRQTPQWLVHLGMTGRLLVNSPEVERPPHTHAVLGLSNGKELRFVDARRFGRLSVYPDDEAIDRGRGGKPAKKSRAAKHSRIGVETYAGTGREPLTIAIEDFVALFRNRRSPIKAALLNQKLLHGVGNIYADEALFRAGLRPKRLAARLNREQLERLRVGLVEVLRQAISLGGSSVSDYVDADGERGFFQLEHRVYQRTGEPCRVCATAIRRVLVGGRSSHYCPRCQK